MYNVLNWWQFLSEIKITKNQLNLNEKKNRFTIWNNDVCK